jgi:hypothetical protein
MLKIIWKNRVEFYPAFCFIIWYLLGSALTSLGVKHPGIGKIGLYTIPAVILYIIAVVRTYSELPEIENNKSKK